MIELSSYKIQELLYESDNSGVYRAVGLDKVEQVILKVLKQGYPTRAELTRYCHEYEMIRGLSGEGIIQAYALETHQKSLVIVLEDFGAEPLYGVIQKQPLAIEPFLKLAIAITQALSQIHAAHVIHKDINPSNIVFNRQTNCVKIIDFGISTRISQVSSSLKHPDVLEGTLAYISPEQTGRMNRFLDYRTDFTRLE
ncbi:protein kinase [Leptolyngbya sp. FACHB-541]|uniref:serine/threonine protein kinase n=1 Tax=Leptolyngbya sp. FACHB-541 TaxID=2692810 RepID=UPI0016899420|nr:protein kinase [Leptolyngbya sp. FACHB-541]MBD2001561.1 protein kinase [Leptolyngbya sp. FACHB-541]